MPGSWTPATLLRRASRGQCANVRFGDLVALVEALGFRLRRVAGSPHIYAHPHLDELVNLQEVNGQAKPYQVRQVTRIALRYALPLRSRR
ncbi:MAG: type II toxin-antitoxin system HicA family toxin [Chloroflexi bacterium]|nr:MAG: type II toxin-antitoxin system HicA family toxin [Chloroflexota bacterium]